MSNFLEVFNTDTWNANIDASQIKQAIDALEEGKILFFPQLKLSLSDPEIYYLSQAPVSDGIKNISYSIKDHQIRGSLENENYNNQLKLILRRFANSSLELIKSYLPDYTEYLQYGRTSLRPVEIAGRKPASYRKDDTRLHVDAFPANPNQGRRILRIFYNFNPDGKARIWKVGQPFEVVANQFFNKIKKPKMGVNWLLKTLKITKGLRTPYDHYMLHIHDAMKYDMQYQQNVPAEIIKFPALSTWMVYTDSVSHAALQGQHALEQTFYLPVRAMRNIHLAPLKILESLAKVTLVQNSS